MPYSLQGQLIKTRQISTVGRKGVDGIVVNTSIPSNIEKILSMVNNSILGDGILWQTEINDRVIHSIQVFIPSIGAAWVIVPSMTRTEIQDVLDTIGQDGGGNIYFMEGIYLLEDPLLIRYSNMHLYGQNLNTVLKCNADWQYAISKADGLTLLPLNQRQAVNGDFAGILDIRGVLSSEIENIKVSGLVLDGFNITKYCDGINARYVGVAQTTGLTEGISRYDSTTVGSDKVNKVGLIVEGCIIEKNERHHGLSLNNCKNCMITNNIIQNNGLALYVTNFSNNTISVNIIQNNNGNGINLNTSSNNTILGNIIQNNSDRAIYLSSNSNNNTVSGNTVQNNSGNGIYLANTYNNTILGNTIQNNNAVGIYSYGYIYNNSITGNTVQNNASHGIQLSLSSNNTVSGNTVQSNAGNGIYLSSTSTYNCINGNVLVSNQLNNINILSGCEYNVVCSNQAGTTILNNGANNRVYNNK